MKVFITGGTGYMGSRLIPLLTGRGHDVKALVREGSQVVDPVMESNSYPFEDSGVEQVCNPSPGLQLG